MAVQYTLIDVFKVVAKRNASDLYVTPNSPPLLRIKNDFHPIKSDPLTVEECNKLILDTMLPAQQEEFIREKDFDYALNIPGVGRFRINVYQASGAYEMVARLIAENPRPLGDLFLPEKIGKIVEKHHNGLIVVAGATGSGKSSTLAGMIDLINSTQKKKIVTIEDPIEIVHKNKLSSISQRELYADTNDFKVALKSAMRQRPDVILIGEMRDKDTVTTALNAAESGHLVFSTLHSINAQETIARILDFYPVNEQQQIRNLLAQTIRAIICQRLIVNNDNETRPLVEIMTQNLRTKEAIRDEEKSHNLHEIMKSGTIDHMQTFESHLIEMVSDDILTAEMALKYTDNADELKREFRNARLI